MLRSPVRLVAVAAALTTAASCAETASPRDPGPAISSSVVRLEIPLAASPRLDLLFVIDNSPAMAPQRAKLLDNYRRFIAVLETIPGGLPDVHIGVITTDVGSRGAYDGAAGPVIGTGPGSCTSDGDRGNLRRIPSVSGSFLSDIGRADGTRVRNYTGSLADAFAELADVGTDGCTYARPLEAMRRALNGNVANTGFFRTDAYLAVVVLTNDDDCSFANAVFTGGELDRSRCTTNDGGLVLVDQYVAFLKSIKPDSNKVFALGAFASPGAPACADARPAPRLAGFLEAFPARSHAVSICEQDLSGALGPFGQLVRATLGVSCLDRPLPDTDPFADGYQPDCAGWYSYVLDGAGVEEVLPICRGTTTSGACFQIADDLMNCFHGPTVVVRNARRFGYDANARAILECVTQ